MKTLILVAILPIITAQNYWNTKVFQYAPILGNQTKVTKYAFQKHSIHKYERQNPTIWSGNGIIYPDSEEFTKLGETKPGFDGPRRRKRSDLDLDLDPTSFKYPLWCWKIFVDCYVFPKHVCCGLKKPNRQKRKAVENSLYVVYGKTKPAFGMPQNSDRRSDVQQNAYDWKPYSPFYIGMPGYKKPIMIKRCETTDMTWCIYNKKNPCCGKYMIDRFYPIGPYVQPTLLENWVSALFQFAGQNPVQFTIIKTIAVTVIAVGLTLAWISLGVYLGVISDEKEKKVEKASRRADEILIIDEPGNWIEHLKNRIIDDDNWQGVRKFACCMTGNEGMKCVDGKFKRNYEKHVSKLGCIHELMYDIQLNSRFQNE